MVVDRSVLRAGTIPSKIIRLTPMTDANAQATTCPYPAASRYYDEGPNDTRLRRPYGEGGVIVRRPRTAPRVATLRLLTPPTEDWKAAWQ